MNRERKFYSNNLSAQKEHESGKLSQSPSQQNILRSRNQNIMNPSIMRGLNPITNPGQVTVTKRSIPQTIATGSHSQNAGAPSNLSSINQPATTQKNTPNIKRIVNIYSTKKPSNLNLESNPRRRRFIGNITALSKEDNLKLRLQSIREQEVLQKSRNLNASTIDHADNSILASGPNAGSNSLLLPELKERTPNVQNIKQYAP